MNKEKIEVCYVCSKQLYVRCTGCKITYCSPDCQESDSNDHKHRHAPESKKPTKPLALQVMESRLPENVLKGVKGESIQERLKRAVQKSPSFSDDLGRLPASSSMINVDKESCIDEKQTKSEIDQANGAVGEVNEREITQTPLKDKNDKMMPVETPEPVEEKSKDADGLVNKIDTNFDECASVQNVILEKQPNSEIDEALSEVFDKKIKETPQMIKNSKMRPVARNLSAPQAPNRYFETPEPVDQYKDANGYLDVIVTNYDDRTSVFTVTLESRIFHATRNKITLNKCYDSEGKPFVNLEDLDKYNSLIIALVNGSWRRCKIIVRNEIYIKDIDTGKEYNLTKGNYPLKYPFERELILHAYAYPIQLVNVHDASSIRVNDFLKIRLLDENYGRVLSAELITDTPQVKKTRNEEMNVPQRLMIENVKVKNFPLGTKDIMLLDGKNIKNGRIHIALASEENQEYYDFVYDRIQDYMEKNQDFNGYRPIRGELALVAYTDGDIYRAVCRGNEGDVYKFILMDWGKLFETNPENIWRMSKELADIPIHSRTVDFKLKSGNSLDKIDLAKTLYKLSEGESFEGFIEMTVKNKYSVTVDDSLVVFEN